MRPGGGAILGAIHGDVGTDVGAICQNRTIAPSCTTRRTRRSHLIDKYEQGTHGDQHSAHLHTAQTVPREARYRGSWRLGCLELSSESPSCGVWTSHHVETRGARRRPCGPMCNDVKRNLND